LTNSNKLEQVEKDYWEKYVDK